MNRGRNKYNAKKTVVDGIRFDSKAEARRYIAMMRDQADQRYVTARVVEGWLENAEKEEKELKR